MNNEINKDSIFTQYQNTNLDYTEVEIKDFSTLGVGEHIVKMKNMDITKDFKGDPQFVFTMTDGEGIFIEYTPVDPMDKRSWLTKRLIKGFGIDFTTATPLKLKKLLLDGKKAKITIKENKYQVTNKEGLLEDKIKNQIKYITPYSEGKESKEEIDNIFQDKKEEVKEDEFPF